VEEEKHTERRQIVCARERREWEKERERGLGEREGRKIE
jgi:hypothetical protein